MTSSTPKLDAIGAMSPLQAEHLCRRVTASDIRSVSQADVDYVMRHATHEQLKAAMRVMVENNRYGDVAAHAEPSVMARAIDRVNEPLLVEAHSKVKSSPQTQSSILAAMSDTVRYQCSATLRRVRAASYASASTTEGEP